MPVLFAKLFTYIVSFGFSELESTFWQCSRWRVALEGCRRRIRCGKRPHNSQAPVNKRSSLPLLVVHLYHLIEVRGLSNASSRHCASHGLVISKLCIMPV